MTVPFRLSVVVCTYNRAALLGEALAALTAEPLAALGVEVIVVDNNSTDDTQTVAQRGLGGVAGARTVFEPAQGLSHARNRGFREARAPWVAYLDDDALVTPGYVARAIGTMADHPFDAFGGLYLPWYKYGRPYWFRDEYASNEGIREVRRLDEHEFFSGGNCLFRKEVLEQLGGFPTAIGMRGQTRSYGEETLVQIRARQVGFRLGFDPGLVIRHLVSRQKMHVRSLLWDRYAAGRDAWRAFEKTPSVGTKVLTAAAALAHAQLQLPRALRRLRAAPDYFLQNVLIDVGGPALYGLGQLLER